MDMLAFSILGLLCRKPSTGYELAKLIVGNLDNFYSIKYSQIYPELGKLKDRKLIDCFVDIRGESLKRKRYFVTEKGKKEYMHWLSDVDPIVGLTNKVFLSRLYFSDLQTLDEHIAFAEAFQNECIENLSRLEEIMNTYKKVPKFGEDDYGNYTILKYYIYDEKYFLEWITDYLAQIKLTYDQQAASAPNIITNLKLRTCEITHR